MRPQKEISSDRILGKVALCFYSTSLVCICLIQVGRVIDVGKRCCDMSGSNLVLQRLFRGEFSQARHSDPKSTGSRILWVVLVADNLETSWTSKGLLFGCYFFCLSIYSLKLGVRHGPHTMLVRGMERSINMNFTNKELVVLCERQGMNTYIFNASEKGSYVP